jgi:hypothetical protein
MNGFSRLGTSGVVPVAPKLAAVAAMCTALIACTKTNSAGPPGTSTPVPAAQQRWEPSSSKYAAGYDKRPHANFLGGPGQATPSTYVAMDYDKPGHPALTSNEVSRLRGILRQVKVCQQRGVRYWLTTSDPGQLYRMKVFFAVQDERGGSYLAGHVFGGTTNEVYLQDGTFVATMREVSDREAIDAEPCF